MKRNVLIVVLMLLCLCACGKKKQPAPTALPTITVMDPTAESTETVEEPAIETSQNSDDKVPVNEIASKVIRELQAVGEQMDDSSAFIVLDTAGKSVWKAPLAGIEEFTVPDFMLDAHGGIRAIGGTESIPGTGIVSLDVYYYSLTQNEYYDLLTTMAQHANDTDDIDEDFGISRKYIEDSRELNSHRHPIFSIYGIGENRGEAEIIAAEKAEYASYGISTDEEIEALTGNRTFTKIGNAEDYNFYYVQSAMNQEDIQGLEADGAQYKAEYESLFNAMEQIAPHFTFARPIGIQELVKEGTGLTFETSNINGNTVKSQDIFSGHKMTMLNIWATTCSACISEMPELIELNKEFEGKGGQIVGLVFDAVEDDLIREAQEIVTDLNIDFLTLLPNDYLRKEFDAMSYPITYFINQKGEIVGEPFMGARVAGYREMMDKYLSEN